MGGNGAFKARIGASGNNEMDYCSTDSSEDMLITLTHVEMMLEMVLHKIMAKNTSKPWDIS